MSLSAPVASPDQKAAVLGGVVAALAKSTGTVQFDKRTVSALPGADGTRIFVDSTSDATSLQADALAGFVNAREIGSATPGHDAPGAGLKTTHWVDITTTQGVAEKLTKAIADASATTPVAQAAAARGFAESMNPAAIPFQGRNATHAIGTEAHLYCGAEPHAADALAETLRRTGIAPEARTAKVDGVEDYFVLVELGEQLNKNLGLALERTLEGRASYASATRRTGHGSGHGGPG